MSSLRARRAGLAVSVFALSPALAEAYDPALERNGFGIGVIENNSGVPAFSPFLSRGRNVMRDSGWGWVRILSDFTRGGSVGVVWNVQDRFCRKEAPLRRPDGSLDADRLDRRAWRFPPNPYDSVTGRYANPMIDGDGDLALRIADYAERGGNILMLTRVAWSLDQINRAT